ncbi:MAG: ROK family transcriptional regulator [Spirochaetaceae bacterium]|nr:ROK family transcriptional regulator [Spirochaetaceae bacterium]
MIRHPLRSNDIRESNEKLVLSILFQNAGISQSQVVKRTGLKAPTVFRIFAKLEEDGYIQPCGEYTPAEPPQGADRKGRRPNYYCVNPSSGYAIGVDFSSLAASAIVVDFKNEVIYNDTIDVEPGINKDGMMAVLEVLIEKAIHQSGIDMERLIGIGIAAPGIVDTETGRVLEYERIGGLSGFGIVEHFRRVFGAPVLAHNNASVIAASAYHYGGAREEGSLFAILVRSGVGGALVNHGEIFLNGTTTALEIGRIHVTTDSNAENLEGICSEPAILGALRARFGVTSWEEIQEQLTTGDLEASLGQVELAFETALRNLNHIFHPEAFLIISRFTILSEYLRAVAERALAGRRVISLVYNPVQACYGATDIVFKQFFLLKPNSV